MEHFRVLPTDPRVLELTDSQIELLFINACQSAGDDELRESYRRIVSKRREAEALPVSDLEKMGYTHEMIEAIKEGIVNG